jgi:uncharacterized protein (DUF2147 family)
MKRLALAALAWGALGLALAQGPTPAGQAAAVAATPGAVELDKLTGAWVRPDGGYVILIKGVGNFGELQATYFNPKPLPFAKARALLEEGVLRARFELQAGGYGGSTYDLRYDRQRDRLIGTYYQAVAKQSFEVEFARK